VASEPRSRRVPSSGDHASFLGTQLRTQPQLTTGLADLEYSYETEFPRPAGGSIVTHEGQVDSTDYESGGVDTASMRTTGQRIVVGETRPGQWEAESGDSGDSAEPEFPNTVAVLDTSGSMDQRDTVSGDSRIAVAKQSARSLVNFVENGNKLGIVDFDYRATTTSSLESLDEDARGVMKDDIDRLSPSGDVDRRGAARGPRSASGHDRAEIDNLALGRGTQRAAIAGFDPAGAKVTWRDNLHDRDGIVSGETLLERLADETGGQSAFRPEPGEIRQVFQQFSISVQNRSQITSERVELTEGDTASGSATVDGSCDEVQFSLSYPGSEITLQPETPTGEPLSEGDGVIHRVGETSEIWTVEEPETGDWSFTMTGEQLSRPEVATTEVSADSPIDADLFINDFHYEQTGMFRVELKATNGEQRYTGGDVTLTATNGDETEEIALRDDRGGPDPVGNDGIYTGISIRNRRASTRFRPPSPAARWPICSETSPADCGSTRSSTPSGRTANASRYRVIRRRPACSSASSSTRRSSGSPPSGRSWPSATGSAETTEPELPPKSGPRPIPGAMPRPGPTPRLVLRRVLRPELTPRPGSKSEAASSSKSRLSTVSRPFCGRIRSS